MILGFYMENLSSNLFLFAGVLLFSFEKKVTKNSFCNRSLKLWFQAMQEKNAFLHAGTRTHIFRRSLPAPNIAGKSFPKANLRIDISN
ncbi:MAG: hypothetical protein AB8H03_13920 [Saprospiraceae bacterium]